MKIYFKKLHDDATIPIRGSKEAAGLDLTSIESITIAPGERQMVSTGLSCMLPIGTYLRIAPRSGLAARHGIDVLAGVIDSDYRGEIKVILQNLGDIPFVVQKGNRIAQGILEYFVMAEVDIVDHLIESDRGVNGLGSTGV